MCHNFKGEFTLPVKKCAILNFGKIWKNMVLLSSIDKTIGYGLTIKQFHVAYNLQSLSK